MSQVINTNALSLVAQNNLNKSQSTLGTAIQRLSSGLRINSAKDDAAGQAISNRFTTSINGLTQASRNANDGISIAQTTEGALNEINDNLQNIHRLAVQANNGTNSDSDRQSIQEEIDARLEEIDRISEQTEFNGVKVLKDDQSLTIQVGANDGQTISIDLSKMNSKTLGMDKFTVATGTIVDPTTLTDVTGTIDAPTGDKFDIGSLSDTAGTPAAGFTPDDIVVDDTGKYYATDGTDYVEITDPTTGEYDSTGITGTAPSGATSVLGQDITTPVTPTLDPSITDATLQTDDKGGYYLAHKDGSLTKADIDSTGAVTDSGTKVTQMSEADAKKLQDTKLGMVDDAIAQVSKLRSALGAVQNRFNSVISNTNTTVTNLSESRSRILDADFASEVSEMSRSNILQSAGTTVLAQANQVPQNVLSLLR